MQTFKYPFYIKFFYRYGNLLVSFLLSLYVFPLLFGIDKNIYLVIPLLIVLFLLYYINKKYLMLYKVMPYQITVEDERLVFENFVFSNKRVVLYFKDIDSLSGGIFDGRLRGMMKVCDGKTKNCLGISDKIIDSRKLITLILSKVNKDIYDQTIENLKKFKERKK